MNQKEYWREYLEKNDKVLIVVTAEVVVLNPESEYVEIILKNQEDKKLYVYGVREATNEFVDRFFASECRFLFDKEQYGVNLEDIEDHLLERYESFNETRKSRLSKYYRMAYAKILEQDDRLFPEDLAGIPQSSENNFESEYSVLKNFKNAGDVCELEIMDTNKNIYYLLLASIEDDWLVAIDEGSMINEATKEIEDGFDCDNSFFFKQAKISAYFYLDGFAPASFFNTKYEVPFYLAYNKLIDESDIGMRMIEILTKNLYKIN